jgi:hypothetical protein
LTARGTYYLLGLTAFDALLLYSIMPRKLQIYSDRFRVALGGPFVISVRFVALKGAHEAASVKSWVYWGIRLATSPRNVVEIERSGGLNMVVSPRDMPFFLEQLNAALAAYREAMPDR